MSALPGARGTKMRGAAGRWLLALVAVAMLLAWLPARPAEAKSYYVDNVKIEATVQPDGSLAVHERREFVFDGSYSWVIQDIVLTGPQGSAQPVAISDIAISEGGTAYQRAASGAGTYSFERKGNTVEITWRFAANNQRRTFDLTYVLSHPVVAHADVAELYWKWIGDEWEVRQNNVRVTLNLPEGAAAGEVRGWGHGPLAGVVDVAPAQVTWTIGQLPAGQMLEGRVAFPLELVPQAARRTNLVRLETIIAEEQRWANQANRSRYVLWASGALGILVLLGSIVGALVMQARHGKKYRPQFSGDYYRELPGNYTPAEAGSLWNFGPVGAQEVTATILDMARRGYLTIEVTAEERKVLGGLFGTRQETQYLLRQTDKDWKGLLEHERLVLSFMFLQVGKGTGELDFSDITAFAKRNPTAMQGFLSQFKGSVAATPAADTFIDRHTEQLKVWQMIGGVMVFIGGAALAVLVSPIGGIPAALGGLVLMIGGGFLRRRTQLGSTHLAMWRAFRRFLLHFSALDRAEVPSLIIWEHYLVYAVVLGVAKEVIDQLKVVFPQIAQPGGVGAHPWLWMHVAGRGSMDMASMVSGLTTSLQTSVATAANFRPSSGGGRGGGFSGGGGFGGGGGGGRAG